MKNLKTICLSKNLYYLNFHNNLQNNKTKLKFKSTKTNMFNNKKVKKNNNKTNSIL